MSSSEDDNSAAPIASPDADESLLRASEESPAQTAGETTYRFVHSASFPELLKTLTATLLVTTYQAGKLIVLRARDERLSMLLRSFGKAMGLAVTPGRIAIASEYQIWTLFNSPDVAAKMKPPGQHDGCFLPRCSHVTGNIDVHEIAWGYDAQGLKLWVVNTLFSCLCTLESEYSFVPRWRPPFVTDIKRQDRCHLNGLAMSNGRPRYVTAFGETDEPEGWRPGKVSGGVVIDVDSGETVARDLAMPHSPRFHGGRLWVLDSGRGQLVTVDQANGKIETVAQLNGYTRGLAFAGPFAFIGLSKIRETAVFGGVPIADAARERPCGVAVIDTRSGQQIGFIEFEATVEELFDVQLLSGISFPAVVGFNKDTIRQACVIAPERRIG